MGAWVLALIEGLPDAFHVSISDITFSPHGGRVAYVAGSGERLAKPPVWRSPSSELLRGTRAGRVRAWLWCSTARSGPVTTRPSRQPPALQRRRRSARLPRPARGRDRPDRGQDGVGPCDYRPSHWHELQFSPTGSTSPASCHMIRGARCS